MGILGRIEKVFIDEEGKRILTVDPGNGSLDDVELFLPPGEDSLPLPDDIVLLVDAQGNAGPIAVAVYAEDAHSDDAGGKRIYSRKSDGSVAAFVRLKSDGTIEISNGSGTIEMNAAGKAVINGNFEVLP